MVPVIPPSERNESRWRTLQTSATGQMLHMGASEQSIIPDLLSRAENLLAGPQPEEGGWWRRKHHCRLQTDKSGEYKFETMYNVCKCSLCNNIL